MRVWFIFSLVNVYVHRLCIKFVFERRWNALTKLRMEFFIFMIIVRLSLKILQFFRCRKRKTATSQSESNDSQNVMTDYRCVSVRMCCKNCLRSNEMNGMERLLLFFAGSLRNPVLALFVIVIVGVKISYPEAYRSRFSWLW